MRIKLFVLALTLLPMAAFAQNSPVGKWKTFDEETGKARSIVEVYEAKDGTLAGKVIETLYAPNPLCDKCTGANKNKPIKGMAILWGLKKDGDGYSGGTVLKPSAGKTYKSKARLLEDGKKFEVSGCIAFICKHQMWTREP
ncbi:MAG TPA: DUF2147 domain-containing protein [Luteimonas sp.]|nr:DUF2147 domain-containing protein [Luteimonas sp.]